MSSFTHTGDPNPREPARARRGRLHLYLGYAAGVGKTYRMLEDAQELSRQGKDIVVGYFEPHGRKDTIARTVGLEMIPTRSTTVAGAVFQEMDTDAILQRNPAICIVDELAHTNVPGSARAKRWEDEQVLLDAGIDVMSNMNIQHLESLNDHIFRITGIRVRETVPDWFIKSASEVIMVDATTNALMNRLRRGVIYAPEKAQRALENFFKESTLSALRELALRQAAHELESREAVESPGAREHGHVSVTAHPRRDRILIFLTPGPSTAMLIRRGRRMADYLEADCFAVWVSSQRRRDDTRAREEMEKHLNFARNLHIETRVLEGADAAGKIIDFTHRNQITHILAARPPIRPWDHLATADPVLQLVEKARDVRIIVVADRRKRS
ncbi:histidine kinase [Occallatibacter riparius]|uniref:Histidine kinase n=1 Tax=Occallatibacter riparius TaxID=1002689 RepID=A0A9J7BSZ8_9BACT|nr:histidine kinase [Occallatibacter riparius]UWZ85776.1 histidine kinase [Occallatibacter riparius]